MKKTIAALALVTLFAGVSLAEAQDKQTLWDQRNAGPVIPDARTLKPPSTQVPANPSTTNWGAQWGSGTYIGIYGKRGWVDMPNTAPGDQNLEIEVDIEMYYADEIANNKVYFHWADPNNLTAENKTASVHGKFTSNNGQWVGFDFSQYSSTPGKFVTSSGKPTGEILDAMVMQKDVLGRDPVAGEANAFNIKIGLQMKGETAARQPDSLSPGASGTIAMGLWWLVNDGKPGSYEYDWKIEMVPNTNQADGYYHFDPKVISSPVL